MSQDDTVTFEEKPRLIFSFHLCLRLTSPNYAFMRRRLYSKRKVHEWTHRRCVLLSNYWSRMRVFEHCSYSPVAILITNWQCKALVFQLAKAIILVHIVISETSSLSEQRDPPLDLQIQ